MKRGIWIGAFATLAIAGGAGWALSGSVPDASAPPPFAIVKGIQPIGSYRIPSDEDIAAEPNAQAIRYGRRLLDETARLLPDHTGASMNCNSCHLGGGKLPGGAPYVNTARNYPGYNPRAGREVTLEERINGCFQRSMNGTPLDPGSAEMRAMVAYITWLSAKVPQGAKVKIATFPPIDKTLTPNPAHGAEVYAAQCASCHGDQGEGLYSADGEVIFPPLWGDKSFNIGAGMARTFTAMAFIKGSMPVSVSAATPVGQGGVLSDQDALDVAEYFSHMPRPDFPAKVKDWPHDRKPPDARY